MSKKFKNKDLAARLGVSGTLVSLVLNNKADRYGILKSTQEKVLQLAKQMGYFESMHEDETGYPIEEKPGIFGMIVPSLNQPFVFEISPLLQKAFSTIGAGFSIVAKDTDDQRYIRFLDAYKKFYSGLILVGDAADINAIKELRTTDYPFVILEKSVSTLKLNTVCTDNAAGALLVADHIGKLGYKNILIVSDPRSFGSDTTVIQELTNTLNLKPGIVNPVVVELDMPKVSGEIDFFEFEEFLRPPYSSELMIIMNSRLVYPIMTLLRKKKFRVPHDIAVISMEEGKGFDLMFTPVTCLRKPLSTLAVKVANLIWSEVKNSGKGKCKRQFNISPELIVRNSCGTM
jgi:LacI family transcriptional regulator